MREKKQESGVMRSSKAQNEKKELTSASQQTAIELIAQLKLTH